MKKPLDDGQLIEQWTKRVHARATEIDEHNERDWYDMALGFFLAYREPVEAESLANRALGEGLL